MRQLSYIIDKQNEGKMIKEYLKNSHCYSTKALTRLKHFDDGILLNNAHARTIDILKEGDKLCLTFYDEDRPYIETSLTCQICYEDEDIIVYNKPPFMPCHTSRGHIDDTLANVYASYCHKKGLDAVFRPLNRLDKDTSGLVVCAKNAYCASRITGGFNKTYSAVVSNQLPLDEGTVDAPIIRENDRDIKRIVSRDGQRAVTHYRVRERFKNACLADFALETGRTHQIRVHMAYLGNALLGDRMYGEESELINRQALHCRKISFIHPVKSTLVSIEADFPEDINHAINILKDE